jgi:ferritin-like protein
VVTGDGSAPTRRGFIGGATAVAAGAMFVSGCGSGHAHGRVRPSLLPANEQDVAILNGALAIEQQAIAGFTAAGPLLSGAAQHAAGRFLGQELRHAGVLRSLVQRAGGVPHAPSPDYNLGHPQTRGQVLGLLRELEQTQIDAYLHAIPLVSSPALRATLASILANDAQHIAVLREVDGLPALDGAFVGG